MKEKAILMSVAVFLSVAGLVQAQPGELHGVIDLTYQSRFIWRGFDWYARNHSAIVPSADIDFYGTGFGANITWARAVGSGFENKEWIVYNPYYRNSCWQDTPHQMDYRVGWKYFNHPDGPLRHSCHPRDLDFQEFFADFSWPGACPGGFVPHYECAVIWPDKGGRRADGCPRSYFRQYGGWFHTFGIRKDWAVPGFLPETPEQTIHTSLDIVYNDGAGPTPISGRNNADHDWSHAVFGVSTDFLLSESHSRLILTPGIYYQSSWDDSVNTSDEYWVTLSLKYEF